ncbi:MAG: hypothetical protein HYZ26_01245 [Chloroflexi bacterium]|nr:hypothetical protein [Chloroflexota bacterium]
MMNRMPNPTAFLPVSIFLALLGYGGLALLLSSTQPTLWPRWLMFFLIVVAGSGTALPVVAFLNFRLPGRPPAAPRVVVRQALWFGVYLAILAWLQVGRVFSPNLALMLLVGLAAIEVLLRLWERSRWQPE